MGVGGWGGCWLDVAVGDAERVEVAHAGRRLPDQVARAQFRNGAEIGEDLGAIGPENDRGHVDHAQPFEHRAIVARFDHSISFSGTETSASVSGAISACAITSLRPCA